MGEGLGIGRDLGFEVFKRFLKVRAKITKSPHDGQKSVQKIKKWAKKWGLILIFGNTPRPRKMRRDIKKWVTFENQSFGL